MKRVYNWSIITTILLLAALGWIGTQNTPHIAVFIAALACLSGAGAVIRYDDHVKLTTPR